MSRIQLQLYVNPGAAEVFVNIRQKDGIYRRFTATVDTGAEVSLLPLVVLDDVEHRLTTRGKIIVDQAGIANQSVEADEALVTIFLEDQTGARTDEFEVRVWFADTDEVLVGFDGILDRAVLHIDMQKRDGWIEMDTPGEC
jgi:hypothetical protein